MKSLPDSNPNSWRYKLVKGYLRLIHETLLVRHRYIIGKENLPLPTRKYFIVCNHQNTANDPLNIVFSLPLSYHVCALARANVFSVNGVFTRFLNWIGLVPAFRFGWEGLDGLESNFESFDLVAKRIHHPYPVVVFPEAGHTQGHYLDRFTTGTVRMAFHAAKVNGWQDDILILPTAHHYEDYFKLRTDFIWMIAKPISLKPYYQDFQEHPNSVMRDITHNLRQCIQAMMLDEGKEDYEVKDFLRCSALNPATMTVMPLPQRLEKDKLFIKQLKENPNYREIIKLSAQLKRNEEALGVTDTTIAEEQGWLKSICWAFILLILLPIWAICLWPHAICYAYPPHLIKSDKMFVNSYRFIMSALMLYPLFALLTLIAMSIAGWWWLGIIWILLWIPTGRFGWWYYQKLRHTIKAFRCLAASDKVGEAEQLRTTIKTLMNK